MSTLKLIRVCSFLKLSFVIFFLTSCASSEFVSIQNLIKGTNQDAKLEWSSLMQNISTYSHEVFNHGGNRRLKNIYETVKVEDRCFGKDGLQMVDHQLCDHLNEYISSITSLSNHLTKDTDIASEVRGCARSLSIDPIEPNFPSFYLMILNCETKLAELQSSQIEFLRSNEHNFKALDIDLGDNPITNYIGVSMSYLNQAMKNIDIYKLKTSKAYHATNARRSKNRPFCEKNLKRFEATGTEIFELQQRWNKAYLAGAGSKKLELEVADILKKVTSTRSELYQALLEKECFISEDPFTDS